MYLRVKIVFDTAENGVVQFICSIHSLTVQLSKFTRGRELDREAACAAICGPIEFTE